MKAFLVTRYGKNEPLQLTETPPPTPQADEVLIEVHAASVNQLDSKIRDGEFKLILPYKPPFGLGHDVAGTVVAVGARVSRFRVGDAVYARPADFHIGTFAELIAVPEADVAHKPRNLTMAEAAAVPLVGLTAWQALVERAQLRPGQKVFIQAGSGGVGTVAIQLAKHLGAFVATTTSAANAELVRRLGADVVIDYKTQDFEALLSDYDVVLNSQDAKTLEKSLRILKPGGVVVSISGPPDGAFAQEAGLPWYVRVVAQLLSFSIRRKARQLGVRFTFLFMKANGQQLEQLTQLLESGIIKPVVDKTFPFAQTNEALAYVETGRAKGKVVVKRQ
ncbi:NADP-dependent oxidoreductase [Hymenobacter jeollabukensis]|uniref:NADP-dependent oxidoreductase n=1 Tax=Hymenobacter jeollabukensis TaxID=2025313 RepID=A0A5R8WWZ1_9BACT|nr:NADP-dependent oxidoreductase [Hymenobacter jeollabukensis]TLM96986.1 NADP-dependent oxidoreductase [Hymenobacter jeollabukensis]